MIRPAILALALLGAACSGSNDDATPIAPPTPPIPAPNSGEWTRIVAETAEGGFRMGNPDAPVKLVEYASLTCPHCATFSREGTVPLKRLVTSGHLSWEFRPVLLFPTDPSMSLLARCGGPRDFFALVEKLYATQDDWSDKLQALSSVELQRMQALLPAQQAAAMVKSAGLDQLLRQQGLAQAQIDRCLTDEQGLEKVTALTSRAREEGVSRTPTFLINGRIAQEGVDWKSLRPALEDSFRS